MADTFSSPMRAITSNIAANKKKNQEEKVMKKTAQREQNTKHKKILQHPVSTPIFLFYLVMAVVKGSFALLLLGTAAAAGAWILETIFIATAADAGTVSSVHVSPASGRQAYKANSTETVTDHRIGSPDTPFSYGILLQETGHRNVVVLRKTA